MSTDTTPASVAAEAAKKARAARSKSGSVKPRNSNKKEAKTKGERKQRATSYSAEQLDAAVSYIKKNKDEGDLDIQRELYFGEKLPIAAIRAAFAKARSLDKYRSIGIWAANEEAQKKAWKESKKEAA